MWQSMLRWHVPEQTEAWSPRETFWLPAGASLCSICALAAPAQCVACWSNQKHSRSCSCLLLSMPGTQGLSWVHTGTQSQGRAPTFSPPAPSGASIPTHCKDCNNMGSVAVGKTKATFPASWEGLQPSWDLPIPSHSVSGQPVAQNTPPPPAPVHREFS